MEADLTGSVLLEEFAAIHQACGKDELERCAKEMYGRQPKVVRTADGDKIIAWEDLPAEERDAVRLDLYHQRVATLDAPGGQSAICLSGGGIRSAAFALGVLQGLARHGLLSRFHYLSTVSGGGYMGGWLTAWASRAATNKTSQPGGISFTDIEKTLAAAGTGPKPLHELRRNQAFLTPKTGLASPDTWAALAHVTRNLFLNWLVFVPLLASLLLVPRIAQSWLLYWSHARFQGPAPGPSLLALVHAEGSTLAANASSIHFWLDSIGTLLICGGVAFSMANRSTDAHTAIDDHGFVYRVILPVSSGTVCLLSSACFWFVTKPALHPSETMFVQWTLLCGAAFLLMRILAWCLAAKGARDLHTAVLELLAQAVSGGLVGALIYTGIWLWYYKLDPQLEDLGNVCVLGLPWFLMSFLMGQVLLSGLTSRLYGREGERNREWLARASGWYAAMAVAWLAFSAIVIYSGQIIAWSASLTGLTLGSGVLSLWGASSPISKAFSMLTRGDRLRPNSVITLISIIFALCLAVWIAHGASLLMHQASLWFPSEVRLESKLTSADPASEATLRLAWTTGASVLLLALSAVASVFVNVNSFSLNGLYRSRLVRAFLGASNIEGVVSGKPSRNPFDGSAGSDDPPMHELWHDVKPGGDPKDKRVVPFPVVNMTLNLTATDDKAWQERKAAPFVATPLKAGGDFVGYRPVRTYAGGLSLGTGMSISGAAVSPNWGYHSSPITSFLMAMFNVRLGCWLGNPRHARTFVSEGPKLGLRLFMQEALGWTTAAEPYVYLSDGGHFENLGLYEMIRRRCRTILVCDAGADPGGTLEDLGNAVRKISIDMGVVIEFKRIDVRKRDADMTNPGVYCAIGTVLYPEENVSQGTIIYIKTGLYNDVPADVRAYAAANAKFPNDTTLNQWFTESQFESYRALGSHVVRVMTRAPNAADAINPAADRRPLDIPGFIGCVNEYLERYAGRGDKPWPIRLVS